MEPPRHGKRTITEIKGILHVGFLSSLEPSIEDSGRHEGIGRMVRDESEAGLGRGRYVVGAEWDEGSMACMR